MTLPKKETKPSLTEEDKRFIYQTLVDNFDIDEEYPLANLGWCLAREGISKDDYGFVKLTPMLEQMSGLVELSSKEVGGVSQSMFRLLDDTAAAQQPRPGRAYREKMAHDIDAHIRAQEHADAAGEGKGAAKCTKRTDAKPEDNAASKGEAKQASKSDDASASKPEGRDASKAGHKECSKSDGKAGSKSEAKSSSASTSKGAGASSSKAMDAGQPGAAVEEDSKSAQVIVQASGQSGQPQAMNSVRPRTYWVLPGRVLERFAYLGDWQEFLANLAALALDEPWDFSKPTGPDGKRFFILYNYIRYTFYRVTLEDKVGFSNDERFAAFNTGLVDRHYEDIYACFEPNSKTNAHQPWAFAGFCIAGTGHFGKKLVRELMPLPEPASYLQRKEDLLFDLDRKIVCDLKHIVVDNIHRMPAAFLRDELASSDECRAVLSGIERIRNPRTLDSRYDKLRDLVSSDTHLFNRMTNAVNAAIEMARRQVRWNYKIAVPAYYPRTNSMNLLLPLNLTGDDKPDVALVVQLQKSGNYQGQTIVTMAQAYCDARLVCRPYIDWLSPSQILGEPTQSDEGDETEHGDVAGADASSVAGASAGAADAFHDTAHGATDASRGATHGAAVS